MFTGTLTGEQIDAANKLCQRKKMLLSWPQGTGKTVVSLACSEKLLELGLISNVLILCPTVISWQWLEKIEEFTDHDNVRHVEAKNKPSREYDSHETIYTIVPYSVFRKDYEKIRRISYDLIIADEAQEFSNFRSKTFKYIKKFKSKYRWALTGTAISNKLEELYAILQWVDPYFLPPWQEFEKRHLVRNPHTKQILKYKNLGPLNKYLASNRVERKTIDELQGTLPEVITNKIYIEKDKEVARNERKLFSVLNKSDSSAHYWGSFDPEVSSAFHEVRRAVCGGTKLSYAVELLRSILGESENNRVIVYCFFKQPIYELQQLLHDHTILSTLFTGDQSAEEKRTSIQALSSGEVRVLLCSNAGKAGLDLPFANYTIHLDVPFSHGISDQRSTRTRRASSSFSTVIVLYLLVRDSIEEYYVEQVTSKRKLAEAALEGGADKVVMRSQSLKDYLAKHYDNRRKY